MKIDKSNVEAVKSAVSDWAESKNFEVKFVERGGQSSPEFGVEADDWGIEVLTQDGWVSLNGYNSLEASTTVMTMEEIPDALDRLLTHVQS